MTTHYFEEVDDCILAAYRHVKDTGCKVEDHNSEEGGDSVGLIATDGTAFMMWMEFHNSSQKRKLAKTIHSLNISVKEFVNKQLLPFL
jgi:hypothetical protein